MIISQRDHLEKVEQAKPLQGLIDSLVSCPLSELPTNLNKNLEWNRPRGDLYHWIPLLNRFDDVFESQIKKYKLNERYVLPHVLEDSDEKLLVSVLDFSAVLLDSCSNRVIYSSTHRLYELINTFSIPVRLSTLKVCTMIGERYCQTNSSRYYAPPDVKNKFFGFAKFFPPALSHGSLSHYSLLDICKNKPVPSKWKMLDFQYYNSNTKVKVTTHSSPKKSKKNAKRSALNTQSLNQSNLQLHSQKSEVAKSEGVQHFIISEENLKKLSLQQVYDKAIQEIPPESYFQFGLKVAVAKAFNNDSYDSIKLKHQLLSIKCLSIAFLALMTSSSLVNAQLFDQEQHLFGYLADLVNPDNSAVVPDDVYFFAIKTFENISMKRIWGSDIIKTLGGNISHGLMFQKIRAVLKDIHDGKKFQEKAVIHFFNMIANVVDTKGLSQNLINAGLLQLLMEFIPLRTTSRWLCSGAVHLISLMIQQQPSALDEFVENDGFKLLRETVEYEVNFAIENPNFGGGPPQHSVVYYKVTFRQNNYIRTLLKFVLYLIQSDSGDRMRNLYDSPILATFNKILANPVLFGPECISNTLAIITSIIHSEPTAYAILSEAGVIDMILSNFENFFGNSEELLLALPDVIGAICLNKKGLAQVVKSDVIGTYFKVFKDVSFAKLLVKEDNSSNLGATFDELSRHYPDLKDIIVSNIVQLVKEIPDIVQSLFAPQEFYQSPKGSLYKSTDDEVVEDEEGQKLLPAWETSDGAYMIDNVALFLAELVQTHQRWKILLDEISIDDWLRLICIKDAPYDYILSNGLFSIAGLLRFFDDENRKYGLEFVLGAVKDTMKSVHDFIYYDNDNVSFFEQFDGVPNGGKLGGEYISAINKIDYLLFILTDVYVTPNNLFPMRMTQLFSYFNDDNGKEMLKDLTMLFRRITLEEINLQSRTPPIAVKDTTFFRTIDFSPVQIILGEANESKVKKLDKTSAVFKNTLQIRFHINRIQSWLGYIFVSITRMAVQKRQDPYSYTPKNAIRLTDTFTDYYLELFSNVYLNDPTMRSAYYLIVLNFLNSLLVTKSRPNEQVVTTFAIIIMQKDGFKNLRDLCMPYIRSIKSFDPAKVEDVKDLKYVQLSMESVTLNIAKQFLTTVSKIVNDNAMMVIPFAASLYGGDQDGLSNIHHEVIISFVVQARLYAFGILLSLLNQDDGILCNDHNIKNYTSPIVELIINISKVVYSSAGEDHVRLHGGRLYPLDWKYAKPSNAKLEYLTGTVGMPEETALEFLSITAGNMQPIYRSEFLQLEMDEAEWETYPRAANDNPYKHIPLKPLEPQFSNFSTLDELVFLRNGNESNFLDQWLMLLQYFPDSVFRISDLLLEVFSRSTYSAKGNVFESLVLVTILEFIQSFDLDAKQGTSNLAVMMQLFGLLLQEDAVFYNAKESLEDFLVVVSESIQPQYVNLEWFPKAMLPYERILADSQVPLLDKIDVPSNALIQKFNNVYRIEQPAKESVLKLLLEIKDLTNFDSALSVCRILVLFAKDTENARLIAKSGIIEILISATRLCFNTSKIFSYQSSLIILVRRCIETPVIIKDIMEHYLADAMGANKKSLSTIKSKSLVTLVKDSSSLVLRSEDVFTEVMANHVRLENPKVPLSILGVRYINKDKESGTEGDVEMVDTCGNSGHVVNSSGIIHFIISELISVSKSDYLSSPPEELEAEKAFKEEKEKDTKSREQFKYNPLANENCAYLAFLLQALTECLASYKQSKLEFLTFSKKQDGKDPLKPRSTALNLFIHKLIPTNKLVKPDGPEFERLFFISTLARAAIFSFVSTPLAKENESPDGIKIDPDISFIMQFTCDVILKVLKDTNHSDLPPNERYSKIFDLIELVGSLISRDRSQFGNIVDKEIVKFDSFHVSKMMLEKGLPHELSSIVANLDLNYPHASKLSISCLKALNSLGHAKKDYQQLFKNGEVEGEEEEMETEEMEPREDTPDLFRNSTLGMYDIEDISEYEDENMDYDEGGAVDIVYSDSDLGSEDIESAAELDDLTEDSEGEMNSDSDISAHIDEDDIQSIVSGSDDDDDDDEDIEFYHDPNIAIQIHGEIDVESDENLSEDYSGDEEDYSEMSFGDEEEEEDISTSDEGLLDEWAANYEEGEGYDDDYDYGESDTFQDDFDRRFEARTPPNVMSHDDDSDADLDMERGEDSSDTASFNISILANGRTEFRVHSTSRRPGEGSEPSLLNPLLQSSAVVPPRFGLMRRLNADIAPELPDFLDAMSNGTGLFDGHFGGRDDGSTQLTQLLRMLGGGESHLRTDSNFKNLNIKSTQQRWSEVSSMFYRNSGPRDATRIVPRIINLIFKSSVDLVSKEKEEEENLRKEQEEEKRKREEEEHKRLEAERALHEAENSDSMSDASQESLEPIYVQIGDREVNIAGTDIDPEFFEALPDDMREEVFTQHVRERRATASTNLSSSIREIDPEFLDALPDNLRQEILAQEALASQYSNFESMVRDSERLEDEEEEVGGELDAKETQVKDSTKQKMYFSPLVDKAGVASLLRLLFTPQSYSHRETMHKTLEYFCHNKQTRSEVMGLLLSFLQDGINDFKSLERSFVQLSIRAKLIVPSKGDQTLTPNEIKSSALLEFPTNTSPLTVAYQAIESIKYLLESDPHMRYYFLIEHENLSSLKKISRQKALNEPTAKSFKFPINSLLSLLKQKLVKEESSLMEVLSRTLQISTRPLQSLKADKSKLAKNEVGQDSDSSMKIDTSYEKEESTQTPHLKETGIVPPFVPDQNLELIINILLADECSGKTFQQTLSAMQNLSVLPNAQKVFPVSLSEKATNLGQALVLDLRSLINVIDKVKSTEDLDGNVLSKFTPASSDQAKLLRVLTALDYLFDSKKDGQRKTSEVKALTDLYKRLALGPLWGALSDALKVLQEKTYLSHISTVLLPLIEALMVVCKHSKVKELSIKEAMRYETNKPDVATEPIESLFFTFTSEHKKILNLMVRANPKLMSGPFSMLVRNPHILEFDNKKNFFDRKLHSDNALKSTLNVNVRRDQVFLDSFRSLFYKPTEEFKNAKLDIKFKGEDGVDAGGVTREWYQVLSRQMFNPDYALFTPVAADKTTFHPNRTSWVNPEHFSFFKFIGRIIGKAVYDNNFLDCHFSRAVYKNILGIPVSLKDMETLDLDYYKSLLWMLDNDITDIIVENFAVETDDYGEHKIIDLIPGGRDIAVTEANKQEYVHRIVEYRLQTSISEQMENFLLGFHEIIPKDLIAIFSEQEVELLISGLPDIDVDDWKNNTTYTNYSASSPQIQWFWRAVRSFDVEERAKLLQFATGTSKVPLHGFKELAGVNGVSKFSIHRDYGSNERLPSSHTCFNQIDLPEYESYETLRHAMLIAINEGREGFGLA